MQVEFRYQEVPLDEVLRFFAKSFSSQDGAPIVNAEWFVDPIKGKVLYRLAVVKPEDKANG